MRTFFSRSPRRGRRHVTLVSPNHPCASANFGSFHEPTMFDSSYDSRDSAGGSGRDSAFDLESFSSFDSEGNSGRNSVTFGSEAWPNGYPNTDCFEPRWAREAASRASGFAVGRGLHAEGIFVSSRREEAVGGLDIGDGPWSLNRPEDAFDAFDLVRPATLYDGVLAMLLDDYLVPMVTLAVDGAPADDLHAIVSLLASYPADIVPSSLILGVVRPDSTGELDRWGQPLVQVQPAQTQCWLDTARSLRDVGIALHDVLILEPDRWFSLADEAGVSRYRSAFEAEGPDCA